MLLPLCFDHEIPKSLRAIEQDLVRYTRRNANNISPHQFPPDATFDAVWKIGEMLHRDMLMVAGGIRLESSSTSVSKSAVQSSNPSGVVVCAVAISTRRKTNSRV